MHLAHEGWASGPADPYRPLEKYRRSLLEKTHTLREWKKLDSCTCQSGWTKLTLLPEDTDESGAHPTNARCDFPWLFQARLSCSVRHLVISRQRIWRTPKNLAHLAVSVTRNCGWANSGMFNFQNPNKLPRHFPGQNAPSSCKQSGTGKSRAWLTDCLDQDMRLLIPLSRNDVPGLSNVERLQTPTADLLRLFNPKLIGFGIVS